MKRILKSSVVLITCFFTCFISVAEEGMWLPQLLQSLNEKDMKKQGMKISAADIYSINKSSLKDAIVSLGGFCTAEVISESGLLLTNHHCGFDVIQNHSSLQKNYIRDGFWAKAHNQELPNRGLTATFIVRIEEVTDIVLQGIAANLTERERQSAIDKNIAALRTSVKKEAYQDMIIRPFFEGNKYFLFVTEVFKDVRLVGAPPSAIGNFGKDTDNWMWPRHTGDFSMFRIYANKDNKPAEYAADNVPYKPKRALNISLDGVKENDFTMVFGFPGRTMQYLHSAAVAQIINVSNPAKIAIRAKALSILNQQMRANEQIKIQYAAKYASIENAYKKWQGEILGLKQKNAVGKKKEYEAQFQNRVLANRVWAVKYGTLLEDIEAAYKEIEPYAFARDLQSETMPRVELFTAGNRIITLINSLADNGVAGYKKILAREKDLLADLYAEYDPAVDQQLFESLLLHYKSQLDTNYLSPAFKQFAAQHNNNFADFARSIYTQSFLSDSNKVNEILAMEPQQATERMRQDAGVQLLSSMQKSYGENVTGKLTEIQNRLNSLQRKYMQAQIEVFKEKNFYPDANSTLRVTYGKAKGMKPRNGITYSMVTDLDGVMEKYVPGDYEFDVPKKLIDLHAKKDYGRYGENGKMPVCFIATNHTTGGNSGSPALDAYGNLVGLNFDRAWEGTMSDIYYDADICRNIMVDIRYVAFIIDKFADAQNLISEMKFVNPKKAKK